MPRVLFGVGCPRRGETQLPGLTLGPVLARLAESEPWIGKGGARVFVNGQEAGMLEGANTPLGDEDVVLVLLW